MHHVKKIAHSSRQRQRKLQVTKLVKTKSTRKRKKNRGNSPIRQQRSTVSNLQSNEEPEVKQYSFEKRDRTTSLMALQMLAEKIAIYKEKYGDIETRNSSIVAPPKSRKKQTQGKK